MGIHVSSFPLLTCIDPVVCFRHACSHDSARFAVVAAGSSQYQELPKKRTRCCLFPAARVIVEDAGTECEVVE